MSRIFFLIFCIGLFFCQLQALDSPISLKKRDSVLQLFDIPINAKNIEAIKKLQAFPDIDVKKVFFNSLKNEPENAYIISSVIQDTKSPEFMLYLAMVESKLKNGATSNMSAAGVWQFIRPTAKNLGLRINGSIDERRDPYLSTKAASEYLIYLKKRFKKWYLAIMAYNVGEGKLAGIIRKLGTDEYSVLIETQLLPYETRSHTKKIISTTLVAYESNMDYRTILKNDEKYVKRVKVAPGTSLKTISNLANIDLEKLRYYNKHVLQSIIPNSIDDFHIYMPKENYEIYVTKNETKKDNSLDNILQVSKVQEKILAKK